TDAARRDQAFDGIGARHGANSCRGLSATGESKETGIKRKEKRRENGLFDRLFDRLLSVYLSGRRPPFESTSSPARARAHFQTFCRNRERVQCVPQALFLSGNARLFSGPKSRSYSSARISSRPFFSSFFSSFDASLMAISFSSRLLGLAA